jgi:hypothetical protein
MVLLKNSKHGAQTKGTAKLPVVLKVRLTKMESDALSLIADTYGICPEIALRCSVADYVSDQMEFLYKAVIAPALEGGKSGDGGSKE